MCDGKSIPVIASACSPGQIILDEKLVLLVPPAHAREELITKLRIRVQVESEGKRDTTRRTLSVAPPPVAPHQSQAVNTEDRSMVSMVFKIV